MFANILEQKGVCIRKELTPTGQTNFAVLKFLLGPEAWGNKTKEMYYSLLSLKMISFVLFAKPRSQVWILIYRNWSIVLVHQHGRRFSVLKHQYGGLDVTRAFSLTCPASLQIYRNERKRFHKKRAQLPQDWFGNTNMATVTSCEYTL